MTDKKEKYEAALQTFEQIYNQKPRPPRNREDFAWWQRYDDWSIRLGKAYENLKQIESEMRGNHE